MNCSIRRNPQTNNISQVLDQNGKESKLFLKIAKHPLIDSTEQAFDIYKNIFSLKTEEDNISFTHSIKGVTTPSFKDALKKAEEGEVIAIGFSEGGEFKKIAEIKKNTDKNSLLGFIQNGVVNNLIAEEKVRVGDNYRLQSEGRTEVMKAVTAETLDSEARAHLGTVDRDDTTFTFKKTIDTVEAVRKNGSIENISNLASMSYEDMQKYDNADDLLAQQVYSQKPITRKVETAAKENVNEEELKGKLKTFINKLGITVTSIDSYIKNYTIRNAVNPNAQALADIANKVIAFTDGQGTVEDLTEEVVHFIVEALPRETTENVLRNIDKSEEYKQFAEIYREIYKDEVSEEELEDAVRREILGKVIKNALLERSQEPSETQKNFIEKAFDLLSTFFEKVRSYLKPEYKTELNDYLAMVDDLLEGDMSQVDNTFGDSVFRFYNLNSNKTENDKLRKALQVTIDQLMKEEKDLQKSNNNSPTNRIALEKIERNLSTALQAQSVRSLITLVQQSSDFIRAAIEDSVKKGNSWALTASEEIVYNNLVNTLRPSINEVGQHISKQFPGNKEWMQIADTINKVSLELDKLEALKKTATTDAVEQLIKEQTIDKGLPKAAQDALRKWMTRAEMDTSVISATFGTLINSSDSMLSLLGLQISKINDEANRGFVSTIKDFQKKIKDLGFTEKEISKFTKNGFIISEVDMPAFQEQLDKNFVEAYKKVMSDNTLTDEEILKKSNKGELPWTPEQEQEVNILKSKANETELERRMTDAYYQEYEKKLEENNISQTTKLELAAYISETQAIKSRAMTKDGVLDISSLKAVDKKRLETLERNRLQLKSFITENGELKKGLRYAEDEEGNIILNERGKPVVEADPTQEMSDEGLIALDLNKLDGSFEKTERAFPQSFLDGLKGLSKEQQIEYLNLNSYRGFSSEFWDNMGKSKSTVERLKEALDDNPENAEEITEIINSIVENNFKIRNIVKNHTYKNNPSEVNVETMSNLELDSVKAYQEALESEFNKAKDYLKDVERADNAVMGESTTNQAFKDKMQDLGLSLDEEFPILNEKTEAKALSYMMEHMTQENAKLSQRVKFAIADFIKGRRKNLPKSLSRYMEANGYSEDDLFDGLKQIKIMRGFAESRLLPYYRKYTPQSYNKFQQDIEAADDITTVLENLKDYEYLEITPNYSFYDTDTSQLNPNYIKNSGFGYTIPNLTKYKNKEFFELFGEVKRDKETGEYISAEKNQKLFELYKATIAFRKQQLETMEVAKGYNIYTTPQIRKQFVEKVSNAFGNVSGVGQKVKDAWEDLMSYTEDEQIQGERLGNQGLVIPKKYVQKLENQTDISTDLFTGLALTNKEAHLYKSRVKHYGTVMAIQDKILTRQYNGKDSGSATNAYKMAESAIQNSVFGVKESVTIPLNTAFGKVDAAKVVNKISAFLRFKALGGSVIIPATGYLTSKGQQIIERAVGQYIDNRAYKLGDAELNKMLPEATKEAGKINAESKLNVLGQYYGAYELENSLNNSKYGSVARNAPRTGMMLWSAVSFAMYGSNLMTVLHDIRIVNGKAIKSTDFIRSYIMQGKTIEQAKEDWKKTEANVIFKYQDVKNGQVVFERERLEKDLGVSGEELDKQIEKIQSDITLQTKLLNIRVDLQLPHDQKVAAQRHFLLNSLLMFKGYLIVSAEQRFKGETLNPVTRQQEIGSYNDAFKFLGGIIREWKTNGHSVVKAFKDSYYGKDVTFERERLKELYRIKEDRIKTFEELEKTRPLTEDEQRMKDNPFSEEEMDELNVLGDKVYTTVERAELRKSNLKRIGVDLAFVNGLMLISMLLRGLADDDKDKDNYALQMANYMMYRWVTESHQAGLGMASNYLDVIQSPLQAFDSVKSVGDSMDFFSDEDKKRNKMFNKLVPFYGEITKFENPYEAFTAKKYFQEIRGNTFNFVPIYELMNTENK